MADAVGAGGRESRVFTLTQADLVEAGGATFDANLRRPKLRALAGAFALVVLLVVLFKDGPVVALAMAITLPLLALLVPFALKRVLIPVQTRILLARDARFRNPWQVAVEPDGLFVENAFGESRYRWSVFRDRLDTPNLVLLMLGTGSYVPLPRRALSAGDATDIEAHLRVAAASG
ncbi:MULTISPECIES: YcxB family protein [Methylobacterium]|uniref:YcxB-like C-terminal domain-containing protein n=1 Tax=Methylobacterium jeotgali TaxID=381630 RepID=A0ABQ4SUK0_9HYPH|nr:MULTISPECIES: YcxB family protein [Methylobacterium]GBU16634.1 hypothetical protein AwMethylo_08490 [Methylobacterium sp.]GJE05570.1 hypothetical protein AOPFMNJM_0873 [Methylobacterium jeotgali]